MKIILVGGGKVGTALARQLSEEDHNVTIVDTNKARVEHLTESYDVLGIVGNGSSITTLAEAGIEDADVFIAVTGSDELNLLCCMFAKKALGCFRTYNPCASGGSSAVLEYALQGNRLQGPACDRERGRYSLLLG